MTALPLIVGIGGLNSAGRSSGFHSYKRMICEVLSEEELLKTWQDLAWRMHLPLDDKPTKEQIKALKDGTLIRKIDSFDPLKVSQYKQSQLSSAQNAAAFICNKAKLPEPLPKDWVIQELDNNNVRVTIEGEIDILLSGDTSLAVTSGANIPAGFDPGKLYNSHHHPRGLKLAVYGASDALNSLGVEWDEILKHVNPDEISVYAGSALSQVDADSLGGVFTRFLTGTRISSKMMPLALAEMPADFVNSYVINSVGSTGANIGACATFLYNLRQAIGDIKAGNAKVVIVGSAEAPLVAEIVEGFNVMGALTTDDDIKNLDNSDEVDNRRACRPFSTNAGFTMAEASQFVILMEDELALKLGVNIYGSIADVFINADANKKSIAKPGIGNYITVAKATALAKAILGQDGLAEHTYISAHGTGTPQNRTSESHILNETAKTFGIKNWPVTAIKSYLGHSISASGGDQLLSALGVWQYGWIPGIKTIDHIADDVYKSNLNILTDHTYVGKSGKEMKAVLINSKGFGGNNATALILSPDETLKILTNKFDASLIKNYQEQNKTIKAISDEIDSKTSVGEEKIIYQFGESIIDESAVTMTPTKITIPGFPREIELPAINPFNFHKD